MLINVNFLRGRLYLSTVSKAYETYVMGDWVKSVYAFLKNKKCRHQTVFERQKAFDERNTYMK